MNQSFLKVLTLIVISITLAFAAPVSFEKAERVAEYATKGKKMKLKHKKVKKAKTEVQTMVVPFAARSAPVENALFYVFENEDSNGFTIVAGDDIFTPILGISENGSYDPDSLPPNFAWYLEELEAEMEFGLDQGAVATPATMAEWVLYAAGDTYTPGQYLIKTQWSQRAPYWNQTPIKSGKRTLTGCVATAMAQIMNYHRFPETFDWDNMKNLTYYPKPSGGCPGGTYYIIGGKHYCLESWNATQANAVSTLMKAAGNAVGTSYGTTGSSAYPARVETGFESFGYDSRNIRFINKSTRYQWEGFGASWEEVLRKQIDQGLPVHFSGRNSKNEGHSLVLDGYDKNGRFHFNWGWGGDKDGWYTISANPSLQWNSSQAATINIRRPYIPMSSSSSEETFYSSSEPELSSSSEEAVIAIWTGKADTTWYTNNKEETEFVLNTAEELAGLSVLVAGINNNTGMPNTFFTGTYNMEGITIKLGRDIILNDTTGWQNWGTKAPANSWFNIGISNTKQFLGSFDGNGHIISGVYGSGLFGNLGNSGVVKNVGVVASYIKGGQYVSLLVGNNYGTVINSYSKGTVMGGWFVGGLVGSNRGIVSNSYSNAEVRGIEVSVYSGNDVGGLVGRNDVVGVISNSYSTGAVSGNKSVGGLVGNNLETVINSFFDKTTSGQTDSQIDTDRGIGKTTEEMQTENFKHLLNSGAIFVQNGIPVKTWEIREGEYPKHCDIPANTIAGVGTEENPYLLTTKEQIEALSALVNVGDDFFRKYLKLGSDIALNDTTGWQNWQTEAPENTFAPIGSYWQNSPFKGSFDGNGFVISGVYINNADKDNGMYQGLFGHLGYNGTIKNLGIIASYINGSQYVGCLVGYNDGIISNSYSNCTVSGGKDMGGLVASNHRTIRNSYSAGTFIKTKIFPSIMGFSAGGLVANNFGTISNSYYDKETSGATDGGVMGKTTAEMQSLDLNFLLNTDASILAMNSWNYTEGEYPKLNNEQAEEMDISSYFEYRDGTEENPYEIKTKEQLEVFSYFVNAGKNFKDEFFKLGNDIMLNDTTDWQNWGEENAPEYYWTAIGNEGNQFDGTFDGDGYTISGIFISSDDKYQGFYANENQGLFGYLGNDGTIKNVGVAASYIKGGRNVGGLVGHNAGTISNAYYIGKVDGAQAAGGLVGYNNGSTISNSYSAGTVNGNSRAGGLVGHVYNNSKVINSYYNNEISNQSDEGKGEGKTTDEMQSQSTYAGWDFENIWNINSSINNGYPYLKGKLIVPLEDAVVASIQAQNYTGQEIEPEFIVTIDGKALVKDEDYIISYSDNINIGTGKISIIGWEEYNYLGTKDIDFEITPKPVTIIGLSAENKEYDGNTDVTILGTAVVNGVIEGEDVTVVTGTAYFEDENVGTGKTVTFSGFSLGGTNAANYILSAQPENVTADITPIPISCTAEQELKDGECIEIKSDSSTPIFSNRGNPSIMGILVQTKSNEIQLSNVPVNLKVEVYNLKGIRIYSGNSGNPSILRHQAERLNSQRLVIEVPTRGLYLIKAGKYTFKAAVR